MKNKKVKKGLKITGFTLLGLILLLLIIPVFFQKQIADIAVKEANKALNAQIAIGDFSLSMFRNFPDITLNLKDLVVENVDEFKGDTLLKTGKFMATIDLFSIFSDTYKIKKIQIKDADVRLKVNEDGKANWDITKPDSVIEAESSEPFVFKLKVDKFEINNANVHYSDIPGKMYADVKKLDFDLKGNFSNDFTTIKTKIKTELVNFKMNGVKYLNKMKFQFQANIDADLKNSKYTIKKNEIRLNALLLKLDGWVAMPEEDIDMDVKLVLPKNDFKNILSLIPAIYAKDFKDIKTSGKVALSAFAKGKLTDKSYPAFGAELQIGNAMFQYPSLPASVSNINIDAKVSNKGGSLNNTVIEVKKFHFAIVNNPFDLTAQIRTPISDPDINVTAKGRINLSDIKKVYPLEATQKMEGVFTMDVALKGLLSYIEKEQYDKFQAKGSMSLQNVVIKDKELFAQDISIPEGQLVFSSAFLHLTKLSARIGRNDMVVSGKVENYIPYIFKDGVLKGSVTIASNYLNINDFSGNEPAATETPSEPLSLIEVPKNLNITANARLKKLIYDNIMIDNAAVTCLIKDSRITIHDLGGNFFNGGVKIKGYYETPTPVRGNADIDLAATNLSIKNIVETFDVVNKYLPVLKSANGNAAMTMEAAATLKQTMAPDYKTLNLAGTFNFSQLQIKGVESLNKIAEALKINAFKTLDLRDVNLSYEIKNGNLTTKPFNFKTGKANVIVESGTIGLDQSLNYTAVIEIPREVLGAEANNLANQLISKAAASGITVPETNTIKFALKLGGTLSKPTVSVGLDKARELIQTNVIETVKETAKETVKEVTNKALEEAQKKADALIAAAQKKADELVAAQKKASDKIIADAQAEAQKMVDAAKNPIEKAAKKKAADLLINEAQKKADQATASTRKQADKVVADAKAEGDKLIEQAKK